MKTEPRPPFQAEQRLGRFDRGVFQWHTLQVLDWDGEWWMWTWCWEKLPVRRNLLLTSAPGSASISESSQQTAGENSDG